MAEVISAHVETDESRDIPPWGLIITTPRRGPLCLMVVVYFRTKRKKYFMRMCITSDGADVMQRGRYRTADLALTINHRLLVALL